MKLSVFDLDRTLLSKNSSFEFCKYLYRNKIFSFYFIIKSFFYCVWHTYFGLTLEGLHRKVFKDLLQGFSVRELSFHVAAFVEKELDSLLYLPAIERLKKAQHLGHFTAILSSSPSFLVRAIAERLQVDEWKSSEYKVDKDDCLCQISSILHGEDKAFWVRKMQEKFHMSIESVTAYSDSYLDLPFLRSAGTAIVVNPDSKLKRVSLKCNWEEI